MTENCLYLDDENATLVLRALSSETWPMATPDASMSNPQALSLAALKRLDYPTVQALLALKAARKRDFIFIDFDHLSAAFERYGVLSYLLDSGAAAQ